MRLPIDEIEPQLGVVSDATLAAKYQVSRERIRQLRKERKILKVSNTFKAPTHKRTKLLVSRLDGIKDKVGTMPDYKIAELANVTLYAVKKYRQAYGIKCWQHKKFYANDLAGIEKDLGTLSDRVIGEKYKISRITVFRLRKDKNIPSIRKHQASI